MKKQQALARAYQAVTGVVAAFFGINMILSWILVASAASMDVSSSWLVWRVIGDLMPFAVLGTFWLLAKGTRWERAYQASALALATVFVAWALGAVATQFLYPYIFSAIAGLENFQLVSDMVYNGIGLVLQLVFLGVFALITHRMKTKQALKFAGHTLLAAGIVLLIVGAAQSAYYALQVSSDLGSYASEFIMYGALALILLLSFLIEKRRGTKNIYRTAAFTGLMQATALYVLAQAGIWLVNDAWPQALIAALASVYVAVAALTLGWLYKSVRPLGASDIV